MKRYYYKLNIFDENLLIKMIEDSDVRWMIEKIYYVLTKTGVSFCSLNENLFYTRDIHNTDFVFYTIDIHNIDHVNKILNNYGIVLLRLDSSIFFVKEYVEPKIKDLVDLSLTTDNEEVSAYLNTVLDDMKKDFGVK